MKKLSNIVESIWSDIQDRSSGETVRKEDLITSKEELKERINQLYEDQGKGDTLDVSSLGKCIACEDLTRVFAYFSDVKKILGLETWNVSKVKNMYYMFGDCKNLTNLNLENWNVSNVEDMSFMFQGCTSLTKLNIGSWNVSNVKKMKHMFAFCTGIRELYIKNWDVHNVTDMNGMFDRCDCIVDLNLSKWDVSNVTNMVCLDVVDN